jgi:hypothetical protein
MLLGVEGIALIIWRFENLAAIFLFHVAAQPHPRRRKTRSTRRSTSFHVRAYVRDFRRPLAQTRPKLRDCRFFRIRASFRSILASIGVGERREKYCRIDYNAFTSVA